MVDSHGAVALWSVLASHWLILIAATAAGFVNAMAGGGTFFSYPAFVASGVPPALASASNTVGLWPGNAVSAFAYRKELYAVRERIPFLAAVSLTGSALGATTLLWIGNAGFARLLPPLVLFATLLFTYAEQVRQWVLQRPQQDAAGERKPYGWWAPTLGLGAVTFYIGFFGGGGNLLLLATLSLMGYQNVQHNNALKNLLAAITIASAFVVFLVQGSIAWPQTAVCLLGSITGGLIGARVARRMSVIWLRRLVITVGFILTGIYTWQYWIKPLTS